MSERPVLVTTEFRGVFFGWATDTSGYTVTLKRARNCVYWLENTDWFMGLASVGPLKGCVVVAVADITLKKVTCVAECTPEAVKAWEEYPCVS